ncbi:MAG: N-acetyltransferase family protein [Gemmatimonadetes bacterium]|nr:N-acetyltransferase family protein [Gemmatimonadota bacterium]
MRPAPTIRPVRDGDFPAIAAIYAHHVLHGSASFELEPPAEPEMRRRAAHVADEGMPYIVAELDGDLAGYAYATVYRTRRAYRFTAEDSIYVRADLVGRGVGRALLAALLHECERIGCRQMIAVIGDSANAASIALHERAGFTHAGVLKSVGWKFGRWLDSVRMQRALGAGDTTAPEP